MRARRCEVATTSPSNLLIRRRSSLRPASFGASHGDDTASQSRRLHPMAMSLQTKASHCIHASSLTTRHECQCALCLHIHAQRRAQDGSNSGVGYTSGIQVARQPSASAKARPSRLADYTRCTLCMTYVRIYVHTRPLMSSLIPSPSNLVSYRVSSSLLPLRCFLLLSLLS